MSGFGLGAGVGLGLRFGLELGFGSRTRAGLMLVLGSGLEAARVRACSVSHTGAGGEVMPLSESKVFFSSSVIYGVCVWVCG